jgi:transposase InsO family protein
MGFIDSMHSEGYAVESVCAVLGSRAARSRRGAYRAWRSRQPAARTISDAHVVDAAGSAAWTTDDLGRRQLTPEGLYGRRKMAVYLRRICQREVSAGAVDRAMRLLGLSGVRRDKGVRTTIPAKNGTRTGDLLNRDFTAPAPNRVWVADFTYCRTWAGFVYVAFIVDVFAQRVVAWHASTSKITELVMTPLRMALWQAAGDGHPAVRGQLICHSDAGSQGGFQWSSQHLDSGGVLGWDGGRGRWRYRQRRWAVGGSGLRIGRYDRRCVHRGGRSLRVLCSVGSGV